MCEHPTVLYCIFDHYFLCHAITCVVYFNTTTFFIQTIKITTYILSLIMDLPVAVVSTASTVFLFYPYRDFVKYYPVKPDLNFITSRYRGLATHLDQWALLTLPDTLMLGLGGRGDFGGLVAASCASGMARRFLNTLIYRMNEKTGARGSAIYKSNWDAITKGLAQQGALSWFVGATPTALVQLLTSGLALRSIGPRRRRADATQQFLWDWWHMFRAHAFFSTVSSPLRAAFSTALHVPTKGSDRMSATSWFNSEIYLYKEAASVSRRMFQDMGIRYFFQDTFRYVLKTSVPFAFNFALFRYLMSSR